MTNTFLLEVASMDYTEYRVQGREVAIVRVHLGKMTNEERKAALVKPLNRMARAKQKQKKEGVLVGSKN